ncbi:MAG: hypothetical protein Q7S79_00870 [bacterium]|nr:hypothetical protein [bacterium]
MDKTSASLIGASIIFLIVYKILYWISSKIYKKEKIRPHTVTSICMFIALGALANTFRLMLNMEYMAKFDILFMTVNILAGIICIWGIWNMKKWGLIGHATFVFIGLLLNISDGNWKPIYLIAFYPLIMLLMHFPKMRWR